MPILEISDETLAKIKGQLGEDLELKSIESMDDLIGEKLAFQCARYIYYGKVERVNQSYIKLSQAQVIFETGDYSRSSPDSGEVAPRGEMYVMRQAIESFYPVRW